MIIRSGLLCLALLLPTNQFSIAAENAPFRLEIRDEATGRGVPLVELTTVHNLQFVTDSAGVVAIRDAELMCEKVFFSVKSHGYEFPQDGFGMRGRIAEVSQGGKVSWKIKRLNIAERLYRVTGAGLYADSVMLGDKSPVNRPSLNSRVAGSDSVLTATYRGKMYWFWGDTLQLKYPLGNFHVTGAVSELPGSGGLPPEIGVNLQYFEGAEGFVKSMAPLPGAGPTWMFGVLVVPDQSGRERLMTGFEKIKGSLEVYQRGLAEFDDERQEFRVTQTYDKDVPLYLHGHPFRHQVNQVDYFYFADPYPVMRVRATQNAVQNLAQYEGFTCLKPGCRASTPEVERDAAGQVVWGWKPDTAAISWSLQQKLLQQRLLQPNETWLGLHNADGGKSVVAHRGSVTWNDLRKKWILIATEIGGTSQLGEVWYSEANHPEGPWRAAVKIVTHEKYSFYNPKQHPQFTQSGGRFLYFEGTYTNSFSGNPTATPRYEYNQMMYRLDLMDSRLAAAQGSE